jgi:hypothetical protein
MGDILGAIQHIDAAAALIPAGVLPGGNAEAGYLCHVESRGPDRWDTYARVSPRSHKACQLPW